MKKSVVNLNSDVYYKGTYWNDIPLVHKYMSKNFTGDESKWWVTDFQKKYAKKPFNKALFLNCGDGRHEREFIDRKIVKNIIAFDISSKLVNIARQKRSKRNIKYIVADANKIKFNNNEFDLVVNIAALHHVQYLNRLLRILSYSLKENGLLVNFDYTGPHRNQYPLISWGIIKTINNILPNDVKRFSLGYPHIPTMLVSDPTEAIHSEFTKKYINRYFEILYHRETGGGIAYELLTHNNNLNKLSKKRLDKYVAKILEIDKLLVRMKIAPSLFSYIIARPNKSVLLNKGKIKKWQDSENLREEISNKLNGTYGLFEYIKYARSTQNKKDLIYLIYKYFSILLLLSKYYFLGY